MEDAPKTKSVPSSFQRRLSFSLLWVLVLIGGTIVWMQGRYDPSAWREQSSMPSIQSRSDLFEGLAPLSPSEQYNADTLSDKINGKADLYLNAGFKDLETRRFALASDQTRWIERYVYDMGGHPNAFSVYSSQRRKDIQTIDLTPHAYVSANGLFMVHGPYYVEIIASESSDLMQSHMVAVASAFVTSRSVAPYHLPELVLFGPDNRVPHTTTLIADSAFGIQSLDWVFTSNYTTEQAEATAFISKRRSVAEARSMADTFIAYWKEYGAETVQTQDSIKGTRIVFILDNYEIAMVQGDYFFGVHEATRLDFGLELVARMGRSIEEAAK